MLDDSFLPTTFRAEAVNTACYVLNRLLVTKPQNKTPYDLLPGRQPIISYLRPFGCHVTIFNTINQLGKFDGKSDSRFLVGYSLNSKTFKEELKKLKRQEKEANDVVWKEATNETHDVKTKSTNLLNAISAAVSVVGPSRALNNNEPSHLDDPLMSHHEDIYASPSVGIFTDSSYDDEGVTRSKVHKNSKAHALVSYIQKKQRNNHKDFQHCLFACFLSQIEPKKISHALEDESWVDAMQEELLQFKIQKVWILVNLPFGKKEIGTKLVYKNKKDERGVVVRNKVHLVAQGYRKEEEIEYDEFFGHVARIEAIRIFLSFASYVGFIVYQ
nr:retrovirus-related Pol polyprotein from transposon TNT 1-94 [Tanacetum cinerariifolium]